MAAWVDAPAVRSILALTDLSAEAEHALSRAATLAVTHGAQLRFMHFTDRASSRFTDPQARLWQRCRVLGRQHGLAVTPVESAGTGLDRVLAAAAEADLLVMHQSQNRKPGAYLKRTPADQLLHALRRAVLVVRSAVSEPYRHAMVALDLGDASAELLRRATVFGGDARLSLCHALDNQVVLRGATAVRGLRSVEERRRAERQQAQAQLAQWADLWCPAARGGDIHLAYGEPWQAVVARQFALGADLLVLGKRPTSFIEDVLQRSVGHRVLARARCDVLFAAV